MDVLAIIIIVRREHRLQCYKKKEGPKLCVTVVKHRMILLLVGPEAKHSKSTAGHVRKKNKKKQDVWGKRCHSLRLVTTVLCDFSASVRGVFRGK
jgi:hypothetical protein